MKLEYSNRGNIFFLQRGCDVGKEEFLRPRSISISKIVIRDCSFVLFFLNQPLCPPSHFKPLLPPHFPPPLLPPTLSYRKYQRKSGFYFRLYSFFSLSFFFMWKTRIKSLYSKCGLWKRRCKGMVRVHTHRFIRVDF